MNKIFNLRTLLILFVGLFTNAQTFIWTGATNNDFFNETNWRDSVTNITPASNTINPSLNIDLSLQINISANITASGSIQFGTGSLALGQANITATSLSGGTVTINENGYIDLSAASPFLNNVQINFTSGIGWVKTTNYKTSSVSANNIGQIKVNNIAGVYQTNLRLDNYYLNGCVIRANLASTTPLTVYDGINKLGNPALITVNTIHSGSAIAGSMNNRIKSFVLKKGFMVTFAIEEDGTGKSKNYIASDADLVLNTLPKTLLNSISFIRVLPWNWVNKKGRTEIGTDLNTTWRYKNNTVDNSTLDWEYFPVSLGGSGTIENNGTSSNIGDNNSIQVLVFNEVDNSNTQVNPKNNVVNEAVNLYKNLMKTGMRLISPTGTAEGANDWLTEFNNKAVAQDVRIDAIGVHWYDWESDPENETTEPSATTIFNRFQAYLTSINNLYGLPIWVTEFNANPHRSSATNLAFINLALPYLETLPYVERYNWIEPNPIPFDSVLDNVVGTGEFYTTRPGTTLTTTGTNYKNQVSTAAIPETTVNKVNNLNLENCVCNP